MSERPKTATATATATDHAAVAKQYAEDVIAGRIVAGKLTRLACERHLADLERYAGPGAVYGFSPDEANRFCRFAEMLPHVKGEWARRDENLRLEPWQSFVYAAKYGWLNRRTGKRRFRIAYTEVARKNAKTTGAAAEALFLLVADGEPGAEVYSAAVDRDQASIVWKIAKQMVEKRPALRDHFRLKPMANAIVAHGEAATFKPLSRDAHSLEGLNPNGAIIDELHAHKTREVWDVIESATGAREQPLISTITTAGSDRAGICYEIRSYAVRVLEGAVDDPSFFAVIYTLDEDDDWTDEANWPKANPNLGVSVRWDDLRNKALKARETPSAQANFLTKHLNVWVNADHGLFDPRAWDACGDQSLDIRDYAGKYTCAIGIDLGAKDDICAMVAAFEVKPGEYRSFVKLWLPEDAIAESKNSQFDGWARSGFLKATDGDIIDFDELEDEIAEWVKLCAPVGVAYDPWSATQTAVHLAGRGIPVVEYPQNLRNFSEPTKLLAAVMKPDRFRHDGNPCMAWMVSNVVGRFDSNDNVRPNKQYAEQKIDGPVALIMALGILTRHAEEARSVYESRGLRTL